MVDRHGGIAEQIVAAFATRDLAAFGALLTDDARWGDDDIPNRCRSRRDVVATFDRLLQRGLGGEVVETTTGRHGVMCRLRVDWPAETRGPHRQTLYQVYLVRDGRIAEIRAYDDPTSALEALDAG